MREHLTKKEEAVLKLIAEGKSRTEAIESVYNCSSKDSVYVLTNKMFSRDIVKQRLSALTEKLNNQIVGKTLKLISAIEKYLPLDERARLLVEIAKSGDKRAQLQALDMIIRLGEGYSPDKQLLLSKSEIYEDIKLIPDDFSQEEKQKGNGEN